MGNPAPADVSGSGSEQSETLSGADSVNPDKPAANGEVKLEPTDDASGEGTKTTFDMGFGEIDLSKPIGYEANIAGPKVKDPETLNILDRSWRLEELVALMHCFNQLIRTNKLHGMSHRFQKNHLCKWFQFQYHSSNNKKNQCLQLLVQLDLLNFIEPTILIIG